MTLEGLLDALRRVNLDVDVENALDALWLAQQGRVLSVHPPSVAAATPPAIESASTTTDPASATLAGLSDPLEPAVEAQSQQAPVYAQGGLSTGDRTVSASPVSLPSGRALPNRLGFARALRPFRKRWPSARDTEIDEEATAHATAELGGEFYPVVRPVLERWFDVDVVLEDDPAIAFWEDTMRDYGRMLRDTGAFRNVRAWRLRVADVSPGSTGWRPRVEAQTGAAMPARFLGGHGVRRLIFFATHGASPRWLDGAYARVIEPWLSTCSVVLLHLRARRRWKRTLLGEPDGTCGALEPGATTSRLHVEPFWWKVADDETGDRRWAPVVELQPRAVGEWASMQMARGSRASAFLLQAAPGDAGALQADEKKPQDFARLAAMLREESPQAFRLAAALSSSAFTIPVARLVQDVRFGAEAEAGDLGDVLLSGLVFERVAASGVRAANTIYFDFFPEAREILQRSLRRADAELIADAVRTRMSEHIERIYGRPDTFGALVPDERGALGLPEWLRPFAEVRASLLGLRAPPPPSQNASDTTEQAADARERDEPTVPSRAAPITTIRILVHETPDGAPLVGVKTAPPMAEEELLTPFPESRFEGAVSDVGRVLYEALVENAAIAAAFARVAALQPGQVCEVAIRTGRRLAHVPWEALRDREGQFLALDSRWRIYRELAPSSALEQGRPLALPFRLLVVCAPVGSPGPELLAAVGEAFRGAEVPFQARIFVNRDELVEQVRGWGDPRWRVDMLASKADMLREIAAWQPHALHLIGDQAPMVPAGMSLASRADVARGDGRATLTIGAIDLVDRSFVRLHLLLLTARGTGFAEVAGLAFAVVETPPATGSDAPIVLIARLYGELTRALGETPAGTDGQVIDWSAVLQSVRQQLFALDVGNLWKAPLLHAWNPRVPVFRAESIDRDAVRNRLIAERDGLLSALDSMRNGGAPVDVVNAVRAQVAALELQLGEVGWTGAPAVSAPEANTGTAAQSKPHTDADDTFPTWEIAFDERGAVASRQTVEELMSRVSERGITDLFVFVHGFNRERTTARALFRQFVDGFQAARAAQSAPLQRPGALFVFWPSIAWAEEVGEENVQSDESPAVAESDESPAVGESDESRGFFSSVVQAVKGPLRPLTYWQMRARAGTVGRSGLGPALGEFARTAPRVRIHIVSHSLGARLAAHALIALSDRTQPAASNIKSATFVQATLPHHVFSPAIPSHPERGGVLKDAGRLVHGPIVVTYSRRDSAASTAYLTAMALSGDDDAPGEKASERAALGFDGARAVDAIESRLERVGGAYAFAPGRIYNIDASEVIAAHEDVARPEIAWLVLCAASAGSPQT